MTKAEAAVSVLSTEMPLSTLRVAKAFIAFSSDGAYFAMSNLEGGLAAWRLSLARTAKSAPVHQAASFHPFGSAHVRALAEPNEVPAEPVAKIPEGGMPAVEGVTEFGIQTPDDHEYFLSKFGDLVGIIRVKRKADGGWSATLAKSNVPRVLTPEAVAEGLMPAAGHSGLPKSLEAVVPAEYRYWKAAGDQARAMRDALVESSFFSDDCVKAVDGELRKVEVKYFLYEPPNDLATKSVTKKVEHHDDGWHVYSEDGSKHLGGPYPSKAKAAERMAQVEGHKKSLADRVFGVVPEHIGSGFFTPMAEDGDWIEALDKQDTTGALAFLSPPDRNTSAKEMIRAASTLKAADWLLEHDDTRVTRLAWLGKGVVFKVDGAPGRLFCASFQPEGAVSFLKDEAVKTVTVQGLTIHIDRPAGYVQRGKADDGTEWERTYSTDYGFIPSTKGGDGEDLDFFVGPNHESKRVFWVAQKKQDGSFDEYKVFVGFDTPRDVRDCYAAHIPMQYFAGMAETTIDMVKALIGVEPTEILKRLAKGWRAHMPTHKFEGISYDDLRRLVCDKICEAFPSKKDPNGNPCSPGPWVTDLFDKAAVYEADGKLWQIGYTFDGQNVTLDGQPTQVFRSYTPVGQAGAPPANSTPEPDPNADAGTPAPDEAGKSLAKRSVRIVTTKAADEQYVLGIVLEPDIVDAQQDTYSAEEIRQAEQKFMTDFRNMGLMHKQMVNESVQILESYIAPVDFDLDGTAIRKGTWLMGVRVKDAELWKAVKDGSLTGFSIGGSAIRRPVATQEV